MLILWQRVNKCIRSLLVRSVLCLLNCKKNRKFAERTVAKQTLFRLTEEEMTLSFILESLSGISLATAP
jgi:hypothetical protein